MSAVHEQASEVTLPADSANVAGQYLTFILAGEEYGVEILKVQEIKGWDVATPIPNTPEHVLGVLNLRGSIVPIIDLRRRFNLKTVPYGPTTVVIVVRMFDDTHERTVGLVVDAVADVYRLETDDIQPPPDLGGTIQTKFVKGLATVDEKMVILLEIDQLIDFDVVNEPIDADTNETVEASERP